MFEIFFKYPAGIFHKGQFVLLTPWPLWLLAAAVVCGTGLLYWHIGRNHGMLSGARPLAIWLLESAMLALILFLLWHPALSVATLRPQQNVVAVLVDDSRSMGIADAGGTREAAARRALDGGLLKSLGSHFQVRLYKFGKEPQRVANSDLHGHRRCGRHARGGGQARAGRRAAQIARLTLPGAAVQVRQRAAARREDGRVQIGR